MNEMRFGCPTTDLVAAGPGRQTKEAKPNEDRTVVTMTGPARDPTWVQDVRSVAW